MLVGEIDTVRHSPALSETECDRRSATLAAGVEQLIGDPFESGISVPVAQADEQAYLHLVNVFQPGDAVRS